MYESPIELIKKQRAQMELDLERKIVSAVQEVGISVDKDELARALKYDRDQYDKGFKDGINAMLEKMTDCGYNVCLLCKHVGCDYSKEPCSKCKEMFNTICDGSYFELEED